MNLKRTIRQNQTAAEHPRRGVAAVEGALVLIVFLLILFGMLDLGLLVLDYNTMSEAARRLARVAIVHGQMAAPAQTIWGPDSVSGTAADGSDYASALSPELVTFNLSSVNYSIQWPSGTNQLDDPVQVTLTYRYAPILPYVLGTQTIPIQAVSTMSVQH